MSLLLLLKSQCYFYRRAISSYPQGAKFLRNHTLGVFTFLILNTPVPTLVGFGGRRERGGGLVVFVLMQPSNVGLLSFWSLHWKNTHVLHVLVVMCESIPIVSFPPPPPSLGKPEHLMHNESPGAGHLAVNSVPPPGILKQNNLLRNILSSFPTALRVRFQTPSFWNKRAFIDHKTPIKAKKPFSFFSGSDSFSWPVLRSYIELKQFCSLKNGK